MTPNYLLVAYDIDHPEVPSNAKKKYIDKASFQTLQQDYFCSLDIGDVPYDIINRRWFSISHIDGHTMVMVIDIKKK